MSAPAKWSRPVIPADAAIDVAFAALCGAALAQAAANARGVLESDNPEYLHQLRVGMRRLLSVLRAFRPLLRRARAKAAVRPLRRAMRAFGRMRDWDVFCQTLERAGASARLLARARRERAALVSAPDLRAGQAKVAAWLEGNPWRKRAELGAPIGDYARRTLDGTYRKLRKRARDIDWRDPARRHRVRIGVKRMRYGCDFFAGCFTPRAVAPFLRRLSKLQDTLGELNDIAVARELLAELGESDATLQRRLVQRERALITSAAKAWDGFERLRPYWRP